MSSFTAEANESSRKRLKTIDPKENEKQDEEEEAIEESQDNKADLYQHIKESEKGTAETIDAATKVRFHMCN